MLPSAQLPIPPPGSIVNGALTNTVVVFCTAATNRISPPDVIACPGISPCAAANWICVCPVTDATVPPAKITGVAPIAA